MMSSLQRILILYFVFISTVFAAFPNTSQIITIKSMQEIENYIEQDTLVLFDLDHTIFEGKEYGYGHANWFYDRIEQGKAQGIDEKTTIKQIFPHWLWSQKNTEVKPVESLTPGLIKKLQKNGIQMIGLTSRQVPLADTSLKQLTSIHISFKSDYLPKDTIAWTTFTAPTLMKDGVIFCSEYNDKGEVLHAYLEKINIHPKKVLFIDDGMRNLQSVMKAYSGEAVVLGLHYPLVAEAKKQGWDAQKVHKIYYQTYLAHPELKEYPLAAI